MGKPATSCDNCRRSRLGCNASSQPGQSCSNCARKGVRCSTRPAVTGAGGQAKVQAANQKQLARTDGPCPILESFEPVDDIHNGGGVKRLPKAASSLSSSLGPTSSIASSDSLARSQQALTLHNLLWNVFTTLLEPRIGLWIGGYGCPFITSRTTSTTLISRLMMKLDKGPVESGRSPLRPYDPWYSVDKEESADSVIGRALVHAVYAYSVRWLHLADGKQEPDLEKRYGFTEQKKQLSDNLWGQARKQMYSIMSRPSYRSILALYLFSIVPTSAQRPGDNISDLCLEASLSHQNYLNAKSQTQFSSQDSILRLIEPELSSNTNVTSQPMNAVLVSQQEEHKSLSSVAYWFSIICDTTRALTRCRPSILLPGCAGEEKVWSAVRKRTQDFHQTYSSLRVYRWRTPFSDDQVITVLQYAYAHKTLVWAAITRVQDAIVHQMSGTSLSEAVDAARKESNRYEEIFGQLLCMCQRDFMLLNRTTQMFYTLLQIHFQVGNLILADTLPSTFVFIDENLNPYDLRLCACRSIIIATNLALQTRMLGVDEPVAMSILLLDPYPDLLTNGIIRTGSSLFILYQAQKLTSENVISMFCVVIAALEVLASISHTAAEAIPLLKGRYEACGIDKSGAFKNDALFHAAVSLAASPDHDLFDADVVRELEHQANLLFLPEQVMEECEDDSNMTGDTENMELLDFDFLSQKWSFNDCFATC